MNNPLCIVYGLIRLNELFPSTLTARFLQSACAFSSPSLPVQVRVVLQSPIDNPVREFSSAHTAFRTVPVNQKNGHLPSPSPHSATPDLRSHT